MVNFVSLNLNGEILSQYKKIKKKFTLKHKKKQTEFELKTVFTVAFIVICLNKICIFHISYTITFLKLMMFIIFARISKNEDSIPAETH